MARLSPLQVAKGQGREPGETALPPFGDPMMQDLLEISVPVAGWGESAVGRARRPETSRIAIGS